MVGMVGRFIYTPLSGDDYEDKKESLAMVMYGWLECSGKR